MNFEESLNYSGNANAPSFPEAPNEIKSIDEDYKKRFKMWDNGINFKVLVDTLKDNFGNINNELLYDPNKYARFGNVQIENTYFDGMLNVNAGKIRLEPKYFKIWVKLNYAKNEVQYYLGLNFKDNIENEKTNELAFFIYSNNFDDIENFITHIGFKNLIIADSLYEKFDEAFEQAKKNPKWLNTLYTYAPQFVLEQRTDEQLYKDLFVLVQFEGIGWWFNNISAPAVRLLANFKNLQSLYEKLYNDSVNVLKLYHSLNKQGKKTLASFLSELAKEYNTVKNSQDPPVMPFGKEYSVDSNLFTNKEKVIIEITKKTLVGTSDWKGNSGGQNIYKYYSIFNEEVNPLDLVVWTNIDSEEKGIVVCALFVKQISDEKEWDSIVEIAVTGTIILSMIVSAGTIAGGASGLMYAFAVIDLSIGTIDLLLQNEELSAKLSKTDEGKWFVENWGYISLLVGAGVLSVATSARILKNGPKVVKQLKNLDKVDGVVDAMVELEKLIKKVKDAVKKPPLKVIDIEDVIIVGQKSENFIELANDVKNILKKLGLKIEFKSVNARILNAKGELVFALNKADLENYIKYLDLPDWHKRKKILDVNKVLKNNPRKYNPKIAKAKGYDIPLSKNGGFTPDFSKTLQHLYKSSKNSIQKIKLTGSYDADFAAAFKKMGITDEKTIESIKNLYTWHHLDDLNHLGESTMQLVLKEAHRNTITHIGSSKQIRQVIGTSKKYLK